MKKWTEAEDETLKKFDGIKTVAELGEMLGRPKGSVCGRRSKLGLTSKRVRENLWTEEHDDVIREYHGVKTAREIGAMIGRTKGAVGARKAILGLKMDGGQRHKFITDFAKRKRASRGGSMSYELQILLLKTAISVLAVVAIVLMLLTMDNMIDRMWSNSNDIRELRAVIRNLENEAKEAK